MKMKWILQFFFTMLISVLVENTSLKTGILLGFWFITFYPISLKEFGFFCACCFTFTIANYGALKNSVFEFTQKDILLMPYNEVFMWGFYCVNSVRLLGNLPSKEYSLKKLLLYAIPFAISFSVIKSETVLALVLAVLLIFGIFLFHSKRNFYFILYFFLMGVTVETLGITFQQWHYPGVQYFVVPLWAPLMWTNIGLIMSQTSIHFFKSHKYIS